LFNYNLLVSLVNKLSLTKPRGWDNWGCMQLR
jgi:hypothetical protein